MTTDAGGGGIDLGQLEQAAREADAGGAAPAAGTQLGAVAPDPRDAQRAQIAAEVSGLVEALATVFAPFFPSIKRIYTAPTIKAVGEAVAPVCVKHGWSITGGKWGEEIAAVAVLAPLTLATVSGVREDMAAMKARDVTPDKKDGAA